MRRGGSGAASGLPAPAAATVRRLRRAVVAGVAITTVVWGGGLLVERARFGSSERAAVNRVAAEVRADFSELAAHLGDTTARVALSGDALSPPGPDTSRTRALFELAATFVNENGDVDALSIYDAGGRPLAWAGRPSSLPDDRILGPEALFVAPGPAGLRLVHIRPIVDSGTAGRIGSVAAEHLLTRDSLPRTGGQPSFTFPTSLVPLSLRPRYEGAGESIPPYGFVIGLPGAPALLEAEVSPDTLHHLRAAWHDRLLGVVLSLVALTLLVVAVCLREWQESARAPGAVATLTVVLIGVLVLARALLVLAVPFDWLWAPDSGLIEAVLLRSSVDYVATSLLLLVLVLLVGELVERWRLTRHAVVDARPALVAKALGVWGPHVLAATGVGGVLLGLERALAAVVHQAGTFGLQFSLHPVLPGRLALLGGTLCLNAAAFWAMIALARLAVTWSRVRRQAIGLRAALAVLYVVLPLGVLSWAGARALSPAPFVPILLAVIVVGALSRWVIPRVRHASQGLRLVVAYLALALPSLVAYPVMVGLEDAALADRIAHQYTPEVLNHRSELRVLLRRSLDDLDAIPGLAEQFATVPPPTGPADTDRAYFLWSQTELGRQRLTSSVELYAPEGTLISRFALNVPAEFLVTDQPVEAGCTWVIFGEAPPSTDDSVLLHAGRAICTTDAHGVTHRVGVLLVHLVLDYGTLPFVAAQDPYADLFRPTLDSVARTDGREIAFAVYGWGRTPVYPTAGTAWSISQSLLQRIFRADREAFWTVLERADQRYRVLLSNDRAGIYAIGYALRRPVDHAVALAEIGVLAGVAFVLLVIALGAVDRLAGRRPVTGRALLREIRQSFYRKLFLLFVGASVVPVLALAFVTRAYVAGQLREGLEAGALRTASAARRVIETVVSQQRRDRTDATSLGDDIMISVSRIIDQDVNVFVNASLLATSQRDLFASGLLPTRTPAEVARAITIERQASYVGEEHLGRLQYTVVAVPVRDGEAGAILTVPLTLRKQEVEREIDALDRRVTLATVLFILLGAGIGYITAERVADPVNRLTRATRRIARGDLDARIHASTADELRRLVDAFNQMAADLKHQRGELERTNRLAAWADMARQVAHDIKNPLTPIQLSAEHLRRVHEDAGRPLGQVLDGCIATILSQVTLLRQISGEFSSFASSPVARPAPTDPLEVIEEVVAPYRAGLPDNVALTVDATGMIPELVLDRGLLGRALVNVIENALHAMRGGGRLTIRVRPVGSGVVLEIADTGVGMDADALEHLFEPYFSTKATGTGLGLTIAKRNVELNGGTIAVTSEKGRGTVVVLTLPAAAPASDGISPPPSR